MLKLNPAAVPVVIDDTRAALKATDQALLANAQMLASVLQGAEQSNLPIDITQELFTAIVAHSGKIVEGRNEMRKTIKLLNTIKNRSDHRAYATGCPDGFPTLINPEGSATGQPAAAVSA